jgi:nucleoside permease NupC
MSVVGLCSCLALLYIMSSHRAQVIHNNNNNMYTVLQIYWRPVVWGIVLQFMFALVILRSDVGRSVFRFLAEQITAFLDYTVAGSSFTYGWGYILLLCYCFIKVHLSMHRQYVLITSESSILYSHSVYSRMWYSSVVSYQWCIIWVLYSLWLNTLRGYYR